MAWLLKLLNAQSIFRCGSMAARKHYAHQ